MKKFAAIVIALFVAASAFAQETEIVPSLGAVFKHQEGFWSPRFQVNANNVIKSQSGNAGRTGFYYTIEYRPGIQFVEDGTSYYLRDLLGVRYYINEQFGINAGVGMFCRGLLGTRVEDRLRKEVGVSYKLVDYPWVLQLGYSTWVGPTANIGYVFPL